MYNINTVKELKTQKELNKHLEKGWKLLSVATNKKGEFFYCIGTKTS